MVSITTRSALGQRTSKQSLRLVRLPVLQVMEAAAEVETHVYMLDDINDILVNIILHYRERFSNLWIQAPHFLRLAILHAPPDGDSCKGLYAYAVDGAHPQATHSSAALVVLIARFLLSEHSATNCR